MSLASALSISLSGIQTTSLQLEQTASNVSNASSEGYTTKKVVTSSAQLGSIGGGVQVTGFKRSENAALFTTLTTATSDASCRSTQNDYLQQVMDILGTSSTDDATLSSTLTDFVNSWNNLAGTPESLVAQRQVVSDAESFCDEIQRIAGEVESLDRQCQSEIESTLTDLNSYLKQIQDLNVKVAQAQNAQLSSGDLQDERDQLVLKVSALVDVKVMDRGNGQIALYSASGYQLVDGSTARSFSYDGTDVVSSTNAALSLNTALSGGKLQALVDFRSDTSTTVTSADISTSLTNANNALTQIQTLNAQIVADQALGLDTSALQATRATAVTQLDSIIAVNTTSNADGSINIKTDAGTTLLNASSIATLSFDGNHVVDSAAPSVALESTLTGGALEVQLNSLGGTASASTDQATSIIQKMRDQLDEIVRAFTDTVTTATSGKSSFAGAYDSATTASGNLASSFFTGTDRTNFSVNAALVNGTATLKSNAASAVSSALLDTTRSFSADGLNVTGSSYTTFTTSLLTGFQQSASNISTLSTTAESSRSYLEEKLTNETSVNTDNELVKLVDYQNAYAASAHVMSVIKDLFEVLQNLL